MTVEFPLEEVVKQKQKYRVIHIWSVSGLGPSRHSAVEKQFSPISFQPFHLQDLVPQIFLCIMSFWKTEGVLELIKYTEKPGHCNPPQRKAADSQCSGQQSLTSSAKLVKRWKLEENQETSSDEHSLRPWCRVKTGCSLSFHRAWF